MYNLDLPTYRIHLHSYERCTRMRGNTSRFIIVARCRDRRPLPSDSDWRRDFAELDRVVS